MMPYEPERYVIVEVVGTKERVVETLNQLSAGNPEHWRKLRKRNNSNDYKGRASYTIDFQGDGSEEVR